MSDISSFKQGVDESLYDAQERYKTLLKRSPNNGYAIEDQLNMFYNGVKPDKKMILDAVVGESMMSVMQKKPLEL